MQEKRIEVIKYYYGINRLGGEGRGGGGDLREEDLVPGMPS